MAQITHSRLNIIINAINSDLTLEKRIEHATWEGFLNRIHAWLSPSFKEALIEKHKQIAQITTHLNLIYNNLNNSRYTDDLILFCDDIIKSLDYLNNLPIINNSKVDFKLNKGNANQLQISATKGRNEIIFSTYANDKLMPIINEKLFFSDLIRNISTTILINKYDIDLDKSIRSKCWTLDYPRLGNIKNDIERLKNDTNDTKNTKNDIEKIYDQFKVSLTDCTPEYILKIFSIYQGTRYHHVISFADGIVQISNGSYFEIGSFANNQLTRITHYPKCKVIRYDDGDKSDITHYIKYEDTLEIKNFKINENGYPTCEIDLIDSSVTLIENKE